MTDLSERDGAVMASDSMRQAAPCMVRQRPFPVGTGPEIPNIHWLPARFSAIIGSPDPFGVDFIQTP